MAVELYHSHIHEYAKCAWDVHIYIFIEHRDLETRKTSMNSQFRYETFFQHKEREAQSFYLGFFICPPISCDTSPRPLRASESQPSRLVSSLNSPNFLQIPQFLRALPVRDVIRTLQPRFPSRAIVTSLSDTSAPLARMNTCVNVVPK